jgi:hypothetical protein
MPPSSGSSFDAGVQFIPDIPTTDDVVPPIDRWFYNDTGATISSTNALSFDLSKTPRWSRVRHYSGTPATDAMLIVGGCIQDIPDKSWGPVRVRGKVASQKVAAGTAQGAGLSGGAAAGTLKTMAAFAAAERLVAIASTAEAAGLAEVVYLGNGVVG